MFYFFFFKQKTAYEMRISDWSSDVCSSDLWSNSFSASPIAVSERIAVTMLPMSAATRGRMALAELRLMSRNVGLRHWSGSSQAKTLTVWPCVPSSSRSEEHTSELQSLMRISYAVFCLKKNNKTLPHATLKTQILHTIN